MQLLLCDNQLAYINKTLKNIYLMLVYLIPPTIIVNLFAGTSILRDYIAISVHADRTKLDL